MRSQLRSIAFYVLSMIAGNFSEFILKTSMPLNRKLDSPLVYQNSTIDEAKIGQKEKRQPLNLPLAKLSSIKLQILVHRHLDTLLHPWKFLGVSHFMEPFNPSTAKPAHTRFLCRNIYLVSLLASRPSAPSARPRNELES
jgi:hypothetical protein